MKTLLPYIIVGLSTGAIYGLAAMGLVLTYKTCGIFNFAHGAVAAAAAYAFFELRTRNSVPWPIALVLCVAVLAPLAGIGFERIARLLEETPTATKVVATVGLMLAVQGTLTAIFGSAAQSFPSFLPTKTLSVASVNLGYDQIIGFAVATGGAAGLYVFFAYTRLGTAMRGSVDNSELLALMATNPRRVRSWAWVIGFSFAGLSGILLAPTIGLNAVLLTLLVVQAFGAAAIGRFTSLPMTFVGGLFIGVIGAVSTKYVGNFHALRGLPPSLPFIVLFVVLLLAGNRLKDPTPPSRANKEPVEVPRVVAVTATTMLLVAAIIVPQVVNTRLPVYTDALAFVLIFVSLRVLVRTSGQVSLCHATFAAVGAVAFSHLGHGVGLPWPLALLGAGLMTVPIGALVAIPAIRLSGLFLGLATFGFGILAQQMIFGTSLMFGTYGGRLAPRPSLGGAFHGDKGFYYVVLLVVILGSIAARAVERSRLGRLLRGLADSPLALSTLGTETNVTRVLVFCFAALLAGIGGALLASSSGLATPTRFGFTNSLIWLVVLAISGRGEISSAVLASIALVVLPIYLTDRNFSNYEQIAFGVAAIVVPALSIRTGGLASRFDAAIRNASRRAGRSRWRERTREVERQRTTRDIALEAQA